MLTSYQDAVLPLDEVSLWNPWEGSNLHFPPYKEGVLCQLGYGASCGRMETDTPNRVCHQFKVDDWSGGHGTPGCPIAPGLA